MTDNDPDLFFAEDGTPRSARFGDIYYSPQDGLAESRAVFLTGCDLPNAWADGGAFSVLELGFGTGLNIAAVMQAWVRDRPATGHLHIFSIEGFLMGAHAAATALGNWPELAMFRAALLEQWPKARHGFHYMDFPQWGVSLTLALMDVRDALTAWDGQADAVFLDGFSPALNPDMWSPEVMQLIAGRTKAGARLATFTVAGFVRRGLQAAGFDVAKRQGFGRKRERLEAVRLPATPRPLPVAPRLAIIGAGIAGASLAYQARNLGLSVDIYDANGPGSGASGNAAALVTPRLDAGDSVIPALFADAHAYAVDLYRRICPQAILSRGIWHCESQPRDAARFERILKQPYFADADLKRFAPGELAEKPDAAGLWMNAALVVEPSAVLATLLSDQTVIPDAVEAYASVEGRIELTMRSGKTLTYDAVAVACGEGVFDLGDLSIHHGLQPVRGQAETALSNTRPANGMSWGGYLVPTRDGFLYGATHDRDDRESAARDADKRRNVEALCTHFPAWAQRVGDGQGQSRASVRVTTRDHLPMAGQVLPGLYALSGLGARGFCLAPVLARDIVAQISGGPSCLSGAAKKILTPRRLVPRSGV